MNIKSDSIYFSFMYYSLFLYINKLIIKIYYEKNLKIKLIKILNF